MKKTIYTISLNHTGQGFSIIMYRAEGEPSPVTSVFKFYRRVSLASAKRVARLMSTIADNLPFAYTGGVSVLGMVKSEYRK